MIGVICPSYGDECGVAEYTKNLFSHIPDSIVVREGDEQFFTTVDTVILQHENSLWTDQAMVAAMIAAREHGCRLHVTVHTVQPNRRLWDMFADSYTALTEQGAQILRDRGCHTVHYCPIGCSLALPAEPRKGMTVGAFGFFEEHKCYFTIADTVLEIPHANMQLFSYNRTNNPLYDTFDKKYHNQPIVAWRSFISQENLLLELHQRCDLLVFWYQELEHASASAAVRMGLASGLPVITSDTNWFRDLGDAVYRPQSLRQGIIDLFVNNDLYTHYQTAAARYCQDRSWANIAQHYCRSIHGYYDCVSKSSGSTF